MQQQKKKEEKKIRNVSAGRTYIGNEKAKGKSVVKVLLLPINLFQHKEGNMEPLPSGGRGLDLFLHQAWMDTIRAETEAAAAATAAELLEQA